MSTHRIRLNQIWYDHIASGQKIYEGRLNKPPTSIYSVSDSIVFIRRHTLETFTVKITEILEFSSYNEALTILPLEQVLPGIQTVEEGCNVYLQWDSIEEQQKFGVRMLKIEH